MLNYEKQRKLIIFLSLAITLCVIVAIVVLVFIWMPEKEIKEYRVGNVSYVNINQDTVIKKYAKDIQSLIIEKNYTDIYNLLAEDYKKYTGMTQETLKEYLEEKNVCIAGLELIQYTINQIEGYNYVYDLNFKVRNEVYSLNIVVKEISPEKYTIAFDGFIDYSANVASSTVNSITLNILERTRYINWAEYKIKITNGYNKKITMNSNNNASPIFIVDGAGDVKKPITTTVPISSFDMAAKSSREYILKFDIHDATDYLSYRYWVITNVAFENMEGLKDIQYLF